MFGKFFFLICLFTGTYTQDRPSCYQWDFNSETYFNEFEPCEGLDVLGLKSYNDVPFEPYRSDVDKHLGNIQAGYACLQSKATFNLDSYTEIDALIYLNSNIEDLESNVTIQAFDTELGEIYPLGTVRVSNEWNQFYARFSRSIDNAKVKNSYMLPNYA